MYVYVYYVHSISCMCVWLADCWLWCVYVYDIMDDTSAMWDNWPIGSWHTKLLFDCFTRFILTLKQAPRMHHFQTKKNQKHFWVGAQPLPRPFLTGEGISLPDPTPSAPWAPRFLRLRRSAFPFLFIRSTSKSRPNNIRGGKMSVRTSVRPSVIHKHGDWDISHFPTFKSKN